jgi:hypothetical protein
MTTYPSPLRARPLSLGRLALSALSLGLVCLPASRARAQEQSPAPGYASAPAVIALGGATVAAYPPPHEQLENPADDADDINENRTYVNLTRPIYLTPNLLTPGGDPLAPVDTTDWWTHLLMNGDNGQLWQYPITAKLVPGGIELQHILGPEINSTPGDPSTGFATGALLRIEGIEHSAATTPDIVLADFEASASLPAGWTGTGGFASGNPTTVQSLPQSGQTATFSGTAPSGFVGSRFLLTKNPAEGSTGTITSAAFTADRSYLHFLMGGGSNAGLRVELLNAANDAVLASTLRTGASSAAMSWARLDLTAYAGQSVKIRLVDAQVSGWAWLAADQFLLSNDPLAPSARAGARTITGAPARASGWSDWMVKVNKTDATNPGMTMDFTLVRNMPYVWIDVAGLDPRLSFATNATVTFRDSAGNVLAGAAIGSREKLCVEVDGRFYGVHLPSAGLFTYDAAAKSLTASMSGGGQGHVVISAMRAADQLDFFDTHAYARPDKTTVTYTYAPATAGGGAVHTHWAYEVTALKPGADTVLQGWLPPHYRETGADLGLVSGLEYATPRGVLRVGVAQAAEGFDIDFPFNGILGNFALPEDAGQPGGFDRAYMEQLLRSYDASNDGVCDDTYYGAKNLVKHARAMHMAKQLGLTDVYENLKAELTASLTDWFTYDGVEENHYFAKNDRWGHIIGYNHVPDFNLAGFTDVHFHYGYYVLAYSLLATEDAAFRDQFKEIAISLARDYANWERNATDYPWMRNFEPMVGHSYAGGTSSPGGNNQESSSESIQAWAGMFLLGEALRGNDARAADIMATAAFGYSIETRAVAEYYDDYHGSPFATAAKDLDGNPATGTQRYGNWPDTFRYGKYAAEYPGHPAWIFTNGIMTDGGNSFANYFSGEPVHTYGIQWLPNAPHMLFRARDPAFVRGQFDTLLKYRGTHFAIANLNPLRSSMKNLRSKWYAAPTTSDPDPRVTAIESGWPTYGMQWAIQALYELNPAFVRDISHEGDPLRDNPLYDQATGQWLVTLPGADTNGAKITFPASIWTPAALIANHPELVPPSTEAGLPNYVLAKWVAAFHTTNGGPGPDWARYKQFYSWDSADYPARDSAASLDQLLAVMQEIGGNSWPLIALCYDGFGEPDFALKVMSEYRNRGLSFANDTESNMFFYFYLSALRGLGPVQSDQHLSVGTSAVFKDAAGNRSYMVENKSASYQLADVYEAGAKIGQVLAYPGTTTRQHGLLDVAAGFAPIGTVPAKNSVGVKVSQDTVAVIFNQTFDPATLDNEVTITGPGSVSLVYKPASTGQVAEYAVQGNWVLGGTYTINVPGTVSNAAHTATVGTAKQFSFTVQGTFGLELTATTPAAGSNNTDPTVASVTLNFNSRIATGTLSGVTLTGASNPSLTYNAAASTSSKIVLNVGAGLQPGGAYTLTIPATVADVYGQSLGAAQVVNFTTSQPSGVLADWPTTLNVSKYTQVASSGESIQVIDPGLIWNFDAVGDYVELSINAAKAGTYNFKATNRANPARGIMKLIVNGTEQPAPYWNQTQGVTPALFDFGNIHLEQGANILRFEVAAQVGTAQPKFSLIDTFFTVVQLDNPQVPGPFAEVGGLVVLEAENFMANTSVTVGGVERTWSPTTSRPGYVGDGAMQSLPNTGVNLSATSVVAGSPRVDYEIMFATPGTYKVWVRGDAAGGDVDDSLHLGLDGAAPDTAKDISLERANGFTWTAKRMNTSAVATVVVTTAGVHTLNLWMREDGAYVDRIVLTTDLNYVPTGNGPAVTGFTPAASSSSFAAMSFASSESSSAGALAPSENDTFTTVGVHDYLLVPDNGGGALDLAFILVPALTGPGYESLDGLYHVEELPGLSVAYDLDGDGAADYFDVVTVGQENRPAPEAAYDPATTSFALSWHDETGAFATRLYASPDATSWSPLNSSSETIDPATNTHGYRLPWSPVSGGPLFIRVEVTDD